MPLYHPKPVWISLLKRSVVLLETALVEHGETYKSQKQKPMSVFARKFLPDLHSQTQANYLKDKVCHDVTCQSRHFSELVQFFQNNRRVQWGGWNVWAASLARRPYSTVFLWNALPSATTEAVDVKTLTAAINVCAPEAEASAAMEIWSRSMTIRVLSHNWVRNAYIVKVLDKLCSVYNDFHGSATDWSTGIVWGRISGRSITLLYSKSNFIFFASWNKPSE